MPVIQVRSRSLILYNQNVNAPRVKKESPLRNLIRKSASAELIRDENGQPVLSATGELQYKTYSGVMTYHAKKRLAKAISLLNQASPWHKVYNPVSRKSVDFKLSFITLTIPSRDVVSAKDGYRLLLKPFLRKLKTQYPGFLYVWKAELQERGQLHYHITSNTLIEHHIISNTWNKILAGHQLLYDYYAKHKHYNAPSTEIRSVRKVANIEAYLLKYVSKSDPYGRSLDGKVWGCSLELSKTSYFADVYNQTNELVINALVEAKKAVIKVLERCTIVEFIKSSPLNALSIGQLMSYKEHIARITNSVPLLC